MRAVSLWQPWASLIAVGAKKWETRSWATRYRGPIAIHAARHWDAECSMALEAHTVQASLHGYFETPILKSRLPFGVIVAVAHLVECRRTDNLTALEVGNDKHFGNFARGRFAWRLGCVERLLEPIPCTGRLGLWTPGPFGNRMASLEAYIEDMRSQNLVQKVGW